MKGWSQGSHRHGNAFGWLVFVSLGLLLAVVSTLSEVPAQGLYGSTVGNVTDNSHAAVPGATVTITHKTTNLSREALTNAEGGYTFATVPPGSYDLRVNLSGFREFRQNEVSVTLNNVTRV